MSTHLPHRHRRQEHDDSPVVVTGIGLATGLNPGGEMASPRVFRDETWRKMRAGASAVRTLEGSGLESDPPYLGCPSPFRVTSGGGRLHDLLGALVDEAANDAGLTLDPPNFDRERAACLIGLSKGDVYAFSRVHERIRAARNHDDDLLRWYWDRAWPSCGASLVAGRYGLQGPSLAPVAACATGLVAVIRGVELIRQGVCDVAVVGSVDASLELVLLAAFRKMKALARVEDPPAAAVRPWDRRRSGFVVGEGGAILILEREDHARRRGVLPYVEVAGGALGSDAYHETDLNPDPSGLAHVIRRALENSNVSASEIDHVNVHGTATRANDPVECAALHSALGRHASRVACSANKSQIGHLLGAAGAAELAITCLAVRDGFVPPTLNLDEPDPACDLDGTPHVGRAMEIRAALKVSIGFGGHLAAAVLRRPEGPRRQSEEAGHE